MAHSRNTRNSNSLDFTSACKCEIHHHVVSMADTTVFTVFNLKTKKMGMKPVNALRKAGVFGKEATRICNLCVAHGSKLTGSVETESQTVNAQEAGCEVVNPDQEIIDTIDTLINQINAKNNVGNECMEKINCLIGIIAATFSRPNIMKDSKTISKLYKNVQNLKDVDSKQFLMARDPLLLSFISNAVGFPINSLCDPPFLYNFAIVIEAIYHLKNKNLILPHCFLVNLIQTFVSGSKMVTALNGKILPAASDATYRSWVKEHGSQEIATPEGDIDVYIDNIWKYVVRSYRVSASRNPSPTVVTAIINIKLNHPLNTLILYVCNIVQP